VEVKVKKRNMTIHPYNQHEANEVIANEVIAVDRHAF
jgi:hypothetical protein